MTFLLDLVKKPKTEDIEVEEYDFDKQVRFTSPTMYSTANTKATFDWQGKPNDSLNDND